MRPATLRRPAVAGRFYPSDRQILASELDRYLGGEDPQLHSQALGCLVPHAGYVYSGSVAGAVYARLPARKSYMVFAPNHFGRGKPLATMTSGAWLTPLGAVEIDQELAEKLLHACRHMADDGEAHAGEHSLEVQLPFLQRRARTFALVPVSIGGVNYAELEQLGLAAAATIRQSGKPVLVIASSDMNHYEPDDLTRKKDRLAIEKVEALDPQGLWEVVRREHISMCGVGPAIAMLTAARELGARNATLIKYATSAEAGGDIEAVVGYAGMIVSA